MKPTARTRRGRTSSERMLGRSREETTNGYQRDTMHGRAEIAGARAGCRERQ
jgi:hypothetical protein